MSQNPAFARRLAGLIGGGKKKDFALSIGVRPHQLSKYLQGQVPRMKVLMQVAKATGKSVEWLIAGEEAYQETRGGMMLAEPQALYGTDRDLTREERELVRMLLAILRGRNRENVQAIKSNVKAFYKSREMDSEPMLPTQRKAAG